MRGLIRAQVGMDTLRWQGLRNGSAPFSSLVPQTLDKDEDRLRVAGANFKSTDVSIPNASLNPELIRPMKFNNRSRQH